MKGSGPWQKFWLAGGGGLVAQVYDENLLDEIIVR